MFVCQLSFSLLRGFFKKKTYSLIYLIFIYLFFTFFQTFQLRKRWWWYLSLVCLFVLDCISEKMNNKHKGMKGLQCFCHLNRLNRVQGCCFSFASVIFTRTHAHSRLFLHGYFLIFLSYCGGKSTLQDLYWRLLHPLLFSYASPGRIQVPLSKFSWRSGNNSL